MTTHLLTSEDLDTIEQTMRTKAEAAIGQGGSASLTWIEACDLIAAARRESYTRRLRLAETTRKTKRKSLGLHHSR